MNNGSQDVDQEMAEAEQHRLEGNHHLALPILIRRISRDNSPSARLAFARVLCEMDCASVGLTLLAGLCQEFPSAQTLQKLYKTLGGQGAPWQPHRLTSMSQPSIVAETLISVDALEELEKENK